MATIQLVNGKLPAEFANESLSWGTMKDEDLLRAFSSFLGSVKDEQAQTLSEQCELWLVFLDSVEKMEAAGWDFQDHNHFTLENHAREQVAYFLNEDVWEYLDSISPTGYFGASEGDGSDYGFWQLESEEDTEE
jgi:hypothetical protein